MLAADEKHPSKKNRSPAKPPLRLQVEWVASSSEGVADRKRAADWEALQAWARRHKQRLQISWRQFLVDVLGITYCEQHRDILACEGWRRRSRGTYDLLKMLRHTRQERGDDFSIKSRTTTIQDIISDYRAEFADVLRSRYAITNISLAPSPRCEASPTAPALEPKPKPRGSGPAAVWLMFNVNASDAPVEEVAAHIVEWAQDHYATTLVVEQVFSRMVSSWSHW